MQPFVFEQWHAWESGNRVLLSDELQKKLREFEKPDDAINWLFLNGHKPAARELNKHCKA